jgi:histidinol phosphatase-like PHP family hydrolase
MASATDLPRIDLHIHTRYSSDVVIMYQGSHTAVEVAEIARQKGLAAVGIAEHCDYVGPGFVRRQNRLVQEAQARHDVEVLSGLEVNIDRFGALSVDPEVASQVDYLIGSLHRFPGATMHWEDEARMNAFVASLGVSGLVQTWMEAVLAGIERNGFDILGHPLAMFRKFGLLKAGHISGYDEPRLKEAGWRIARAAAKHGVAIEMNNYTVDFPGYEAFVVTCHQEGTLFSLGSDAHPLEKVGQIQDAVELLERVGVTSDRIVTANTLRSRQGGRGSWNH